MSSSPATNVIDRRSAAPRTHALDMEPHPDDVTQSGLGYVPHSHDTTCAKGQKCCACWWCCCNTEVKKVFCGLARERPSPEGIVQREMHCRVRSNRRKCTDVGCLALLLVSLAFWAGGAAFVIPRSNWRRLVYGKDSLGRTCGEGAREDRKRLYFPNVQNDLLILDAMEAAEDDDTTSDVDVYMDLTSICVAECPVAGDIVCTEDYLADEGVAPNSTVLEQCYGDVPVTVSPTSTNASLSLTAVQRNAFYLDNEYLCASCWVVPLNTTDVFYHCIEETASVSTKERRCTFPDNPVDPNDPAHIAPDDDRCIVVSELVTSSVQQSTVHQQDDPVSAALSASITGLNGWCLDIINTWPVILGIAPLTSGVVCFLSLISIGRSCRAGWCADQRPHGARGRYCSATTFFVWTYMGFGLLLAIAMTAFAWLNTGLFNVGVATEYLGNSSSDLGQSLSGVLNGYTVNVTALGIDIFVGTGLSELVGLQVRIEENQTAWRIIGFAALLICFLAVVAVATLTNKIKMAIKIIDEASVPVRRHVGLLFLPMFSATISAATVVWLAYLTVMVASVDSFQLANISDAAEDFVNSFKSCTLRVNVNETTIATDECPDILSIPSFDSEVADLRTGYLIFHFVMFLWVAEINFVMCNLITAGAVADWYWTRSSGPKNRPDPSKATKGGDGRTLLFVVLRSIARAWRYHLGTAALGAVIIPLCYPFWLCFNYIENQLHNWERKSRCSRCCHAFLQKGCLCYFTKCLRMFHKDAYCLVAMQGHGFFDSCYHVAAILSTTFSQVAGFKHANSVVFTFAKWTISSLCALTVYLALFFQVNVTLGIPSATSHVIPSFIAGVVGFMVARCFFDVYMTGVETMLVCFCEDTMVHNVERNDPNEKHEEVFMPASLVYTTLTVTERRNYGFYTSDDVQLIKQDIDFLHDMQQEGEEEATEAAIQVSRRHNYQLKAPITAEKVINTLKQEAHEALAGSAHTSYTLEQICSIGRIRHGVDLRKGVDLYGHKGVTAPGGSVGANPSKQDKPYKNVQVSPQKSTVRRTLVNGRTVGPDKAAAVDFI